MDPQARRERLPIAPDGRDLEGGGPDLAGQEPRELRLARPRCADQHDVDAGRARHQGSLEEAARGRPLADQVREVVGAQLGGRRPSEQLVDEHVGGGVAPHEQAAQVGPNGHLGVVVVGLRIRSHQATGAKRASRALCLREGLRIHLEHGGEELGPLVLWMWAGLVHALTQTGDLIGGDKEHQQRPVDRTEAQEVAEPPDIAVQARLRLGGQGLARAVAPAHRGPPRRGRLDTPRRTKQPAQVRVHELQAVSKCRSCAGETHSAQRESRALGRGVAQFVHVSLPTPRDTPLRHQVSHPGWPR